MTAHDEPSIVDGNAAAGLLSEVFAGDPTIFVGTCRGCGAEAVLAEAVVEIDEAAAIIRCRSCTHTLLTVLREPAGLRLVVGTLRDLRLG
jgi:hypothetical protein